MLDLQLHRYCHVGSGKRCIVHFDCLIANAPAKAFICQVKQHSSYFSCGKCCARGVYTYGRVDFSSSDYARRSVGSFCSRLQQEHHVGVSPLEALSTVMAHPFPPDYTHSVHLVVMKRLISVWRSGSIRRNIRLSSLPSAM
ncbi:uncharacterized protein DEA37_0002980 [Paragonimus westermani]|uniref:Uncharacterized protein n=1 Tax=Paragonimus westermani TaxID=34504 RepID=A0A5J4P1K1_9TREM|nr:uncharacterized protein DEA37_0002980 [Paragonimus westermani]